MKRQKLFFTAILFFICSTLAIGQTTTDQPTAKEIIQKCIDKMGGADYLRSIKTLYTEWETVMEGNPVTWVTKEMLPNKGAFQIIYKGNTVYQDWFNGKKGFETNRGQVVETPKDQLTDKIPRRNIFNELDYLDPAIYTIERLEDQVIRETDCYKVKARFLTGRTKVLYIDKRSFDIIREDVSAANSPTTSITYFSDFKKFGDLYFYGKMTMGEGPDAQVATVTRLLVNEKIKERDFTK